MALTRDLIESNVRERARWRIAAGTTAGKQGKPIFGIMPNDNRGARHKLRKS